MSSNKIKTVCFDMWGTLAEGGGGNEWVGLQEILGAGSINNKKFKQEGIKSLLSNPLTIKRNIQNLANNLDLKVSTETIEKAYNFWWNLVQKSKLYPETIPVLEKLKRLGIKLIIMSNSDIQSLAYKLEEYDMEKYFVKIFNSAQYGALKQDGKMFIAAHEFLALPKDRVLMVDDSNEHGVIPARNFGWKALWLARGKEENDRFKIKDLKGIFEYL